jgi:hypothetical protein
MSNARILRPVTAATGQSRAHSTVILFFFSTTTKPGKKIYLPSLRMKVPDHVYVFGSLLLQ